MSQPVIEGEYIFSQQEMVAGFHFTPDGKFDFFFSYGAADRSATGTFIVEGDMIKLKSDKEAGKDFTISSQSQAGEGYLIQFEDPNKYLLTDIRCTCLIGEETYEKYSDNYGRIQFDFPHCDKIYAQHALFPDIFTLVKDEENANNNFTLLLNPSLGQVSFKAIDFKIEDAKTISCIPNYLMMVEDIQFEKQ